VNTASKLQIACEIDGKRTSVALVIEIKIEANLAFDRLSGAAGLFGLAFHNKLTM
jgi:hypothetical protein